MPVTVIPWAASLAARSGSTRAVVNSVLPLGSGDFSVPRIASAPMLTSDTLLAVTSWSNWL
jgi:hypothetical protein